MASVALCCIQTGEALGVRMRLTNLPSPGAREAEMPAAVFRGLSPTLCGGHVSRGSLAASDEGALATDPALGVTGPLHQPAAARGPPEHFAPLSAGWTPSQDPPPFHLPSGLCRGRCLSLPLPSSLSIFLHEAFFPQIKPLCIQSHLDVFLEGLH